MNETPSDAEAECNKAHLSKWGVYDRKESAGYMQASNAMRSPKQAQPELQTDIMCPEKNLIDVHVRHGDANVS